MIILDFPKLKSLDSRNYSIEHEDVAMRNKMEGGYVQTRARHTRASRRVFSIGFTMMNESERAELEDFWNQVRGGAKSFYWEDPITLERVLVRFKGGPLSFKYAGKGGTHRWTVSNLKLEEV